MSSMVIERSALCGVRPERAAGVVTAEGLALVERGMAMLAGVAASGRLVELPAAAMIEVAERAQAVADQGAAFASAATRTVHHGDVLSGAGFASTSAWLQSSCRLSRSDAAALVGRAWDCQTTFAATERAWLSGEISQGSVREITRAITAAMHHVPESDRVRESQRAEQVLLEVARRGTVADVARAAKFLKLVVDPDGARQAQIDAYDDQQLAFRDIGTMVSLTGYLTIETAAAVRTALEQVVDGWYRDGALTGDDQPSGSTVIDRQRVKLRKPHLLALALAHLAGQALDGGLLGTKHGVRPHVTLTADLHRVLAGLGGDVLLPGDGPQLVPSETVARVLCDADVDPVLTLSGTGEVHGCDGAHNLIGDRRQPEWQELLLQALNDETRTVLWVGRTMRTTPPRLRRALEVRDRHCQFSGCRVTPDRCQAHHVIPWERGGPTDPSNCLLLCSKHHHAVHEGGWTITRDESTDPLAAGGWELSPPHRPPQPW